jgi:hypothetical protein
MGLTGQLLKSKAVLVYAIFSQQDKVAFDTQLLEPNGLQNISDEQGLKNIRGNLLFVEGAVGKDCA